MPFYVHESFGTTKRCPQVKWRRCAGSGQLPAIDSVADLERVFRQIAACEFLADEPVLYREPLEYGHFAIGGQRKRVLIVGILSDIGGSRLTGSVREKLLSFVNVKNDEYARLLTIPIVQTNKSSALATATHNLARLDSHHPAAVRVFSRLIQRFVDDNDDDEEGGA